MVLTLPINFEDNWCWEECPAEILNIATTIFDILI